MRPLHPAKILCVSPDERLLGDVVHPLATAGFAPVRSSDPPDASALVAAGTDVLVLDVRCATGGLVRAVRQSSPRTSVLVVGGGGDGVIADATVAAPVDPESLLAIMRALVRLSGARPAVRAAFRAWSPALDALHDGLCLRDHDDVVLRCNRAFAESLGSTPLATAGRRIPVRDLLGDVALPGSVHVRGRWFQASLDTIRDDEGLACGTTLVLAVDSERTLFEHERERALRDAAAQDRERDEFLSVASHELRTPLTTVQLQVQALQLWASRTDTPMDPAMVREKLGKAEREVRRLIRLVAEILDGAKLERGRIELHAEEVELGGLVREVVERMSGRFASSTSRVTVHAADPVVGFWDKGRMEQVVTNLLMNAFLYGRGRPIEVSVSSTNARARLEVRDEGIGIAAEDQQRIFKRFARATRDRSLPGFGVGLWTARRVLEAMGGDVVVESEPDVGSTFIVDLPLAPVRDGALAVRRG